MKKFAKPTFTKDERDEEKTKIHIGYRTGFLIAGYDFDKPIESKFKQFTTVIKERINGVDKKRAAHEAINKFGWATFYRESNILQFGVKYDSLNGGPSKIGYVALQKYNQLLAHYLQRAGWGNIKKDEMGNFTIELDTKTNIQNLCTLSPSIGFYYKSERPDMAYIEQCKRCIKINALTTYKSHESR